MQRGWAEDSQRMHQPQRCQQPQFPTSAWPVHPTPGCPSSSSSLVMEEQLNHFLEPTDAGEVRGQSQGGPCSSAETMPQSQRI